MRLRRALLPRPNAAVLVLLSLGLACYRADIPNRAHKLSSGRTIKLISVIRDDPSAWHLSYQTDQVGSDFKVTDDELSELKKEVAEIWKDFQKDVDQAKREEATIEAYLGRNVILGQEHGPRRSFRFRFTRSPDGIWSDKQGVLGPAP